MLASRILIAAVGALAMGLGAVGAAAKQADERPDRTLRVLDRPAKTLDRALDRHRELERRRERRRPQWVAADGDAVAGVSRATLESIASCESGGDPSATSADGSYRGKYQFDTGTWASVGGKGDPANASEAEQDYRAALLYARSGSGPWPVCG